MTRTRIAIVALLLLQCACFREVREERQLGHTAYLRFPRVESAVRVDLTNDASASLSFEVAPDASARYEVPSGTWRITASRDGATLMDRKLFLGAGETRAFDLR